MHALDLSVAEKNSRVQPMRQYRPSSAGMVDGSSVTRRFSSGAVNEIFSKRLPIICTHTSMHKHHMIGWSKTRYHAN